MHTIGSRREFGHLLNHLSLVDDGAEIGVRYGSFSKILLDTWWGKRLYLIDPWKALDDYKESDAVKNMDDADFDDWMLRTLHTIKPHVERVEIMRMRSDQAAERFTVESIDFAYIDANHGLIRQDLALWYPIIRTGGIFAGDDYTDPRFDIKPAVDEFAESHGRTVNLTTDDPMSTSWWWIK